MSHWLIVLILPLLLLSGTHGDFCDTWNGPNEWYMSCYYGAMTQFNPRVTTSGAYITRDYVKQQLEERCSSFWPTVMSCMQQKVLTEQINRGCQNSGDIMNTVQKHTSTCENRNISQQALTALLHFHNFSIMCMPPPDDCLQLFYKAFYVQSQSFNEGISQLQRITNQFIRCYNNSLTSTESEQCTQQIHDVYMYSVLLSPIPPVLGCYIDLNRIQR